MNLLRRIACLPGLRAVLLRPAVRRRVAGVLALRFLAVAWCTDAPLRFLDDELVLARGRARSHRLRDGRSVTIVHGRDTQAFDEIFRGGEYEPPGELAARLGAVRRIVDVGGNVGLFAAWAVGRWPGAHVISIEPDPDNLAPFRSWLSASGTRAVELIEACALTHAGNAVPAGGSGAGSSFVESVVGGVRGIDLFEHLDGVDLLKIDIEGGEWPLLADDRLRELHDLALVMEYHRRGAPSLPAYDAARDLLTAAGFEIRGHRPNHWGHGVLWASKGAA
ncbi:MAG: FkbM family methyltransferase [Nocardioidaceae bacterium]|nr:FkbM family methyltransferase [Nocardioidaceae bacterium]